MNIKTLYGQYKKLFQNEKKQGNIQNGVRQDTFKEFQHDMADPAYGSVKNILDAQRNVKQEDKKRVWSEYQKLVKKRGLKRGEATQQDFTYWGSNENNVEGIGYHTTFSGLMRDRHAVHFLIAERIAEGEDSKDVLADFGY